MKHLCEIHLTVIPECRIYRCHRYFSFLLMTGTQRLYHHCLKNTCKNVNRKIVSDHFYMNLTKVRNLPRTLTSLLSRNG